MVAELVYQAKSVLDSVLMMQELTKHNAVTMWMPQRIKAIVRISLQVEAHPLWAPVLFRMLGE